MKPIPRAGLIGIGGFGIHHVNALIQLERENLCRFVAAADPNVPLTPPGAKHLRIYSDHETMLADNSLDYVVVCSPPAFHLNHVMTVLDHGAFVYLEKPPTPTYHQLERLLAYPGSDRVIVGFQMLEAPAVQSLKHRLSHGGVGPVRHVCSSGLWPRPDSYYRRAKWAGKMHCDEFEVFDGPLTNAFAHLLQQIFYILGDEHSRFARPACVRGWLARARDIDSYDFGWIRGKTTAGTTFEIAVGHCSAQLVPWQLDVHTTTGRMTMRESDIPPTHSALLLNAHRRAFSALAMEAPPTCALADCIGYSEATCSALISSGTIHDIPAHEKNVATNGNDALIDVPGIVSMVERAQQLGILTDPLNEWFSPGREVIPKEIHSLQLGEMYSSHETNFAA
ncbi:MAG: Gfo/Idh/MocA family oxidoreductase [Verrucomicrobia bacterium]|nr:Gfo/Idh/MocA family oxidoreductase [Verrucomicrobiota bacterium]